MTLNSHIYGGLIGMEHAVNKKLLIDLLFFFYFAVPLILLKVCPNVFLINYTQNTSIKTTVMFSFLGGGKKKSSSRIPLSRFT